MIVGIIFIIIGYLVGSISPAYFLTKLIKHVDIRKTGDGKAGATNVLHVVGFWPAILTALFDLVKGILAFAIASMFSGGTWPFFAALAAVIGHIFPFYLNFKGGQGAATCAGLFLYFIYLLVIDKFLPIGSLFILIAVVTAIFAITRKKEFIVLISMPSMIFLLWKNYNIDNLVIFTSIICLYLFIQSVYYAWKRKLFKLKPNTKKHMIVWRSLARPLAIVFPIAYFYFDKTVILYFVGALMLIPLIADIVRLLSGKLNLFFFKKITYIYKSGEEKRFSSITLFFLSIFLTILLFDKNIAIVSISFLIFGDLFAKFFGLEYGKIKIFGDKTLEGSLGHFVACLLVGYLLWPYTNLSFELIFLSSVVATVFEAIPLGINDNFTVSILTGFFMQIGKKWFV